MHMHSYAYESSRRGWVFAGRTPGRTSVERRHLPLAPPPGCAEQPARHRMVRRVIGDAAWIDVVVDRVSVQRHHHHMGEPGLVDDGAAPGREGLADHRAD